MQIKDILTDAVDLFEWDSFAAVAPGQQVLADLGDLLRADPAGYALAARFIPEEFAHPHRGVEGIRAFGEDRQPGPEHEVTLGHVRERGEGAFIQRQLAGIEEGIVHQHAVDELVELLPLAGRIMFELDGVPVGVAKEALTLAAAKLPIKTRFIERIAE